MSFADILPYLAGGLAGAAVPGLGRGAGRAMVMQQAFERDDKSDARYNESVQYRRERDKQSDERYVSEQGRIAEGTEYNRNRDAMGDLRSAVKLADDKVQQDRLWDFRENEQTYQHGRDTKTDARNLVSDDQAKQVFDARMKSFGTQEKISAHQLNRMMIDDENEQNGYDKAVQYFADKEIDVMGMPPESVFRLYSNDISKKMGGSEVTDQQAYKAGLAAYDSEIQHFADMIADENIPETAKVELRTQLMAAQLQKRNYLGLSMDPEAILRDEELDALIEEGKGNEFKLWLGRGLENVGEFADDPAGTVAGAFDRWMTEDERAAFQEITGPATSVARGVLNPLEGILSAGKMVSGIGRDSIQSAMDQVFPNAPDLMRMNVAPLMSIPANIAEGKISAGERARLEKMKTAERIAKGLAQE